MVTDSKSIYDRILLDIPPKRRAGIRYPIVFFLMGITFLALTLISVLVDIPAGTDQAARGLADQVRPIGTIALIIIASRVVWTRVNPQHRTIRHVFANFPEVRITIRKCRVGPEVFRRYLPELRIDGGSFFIADYRMRHDQQFQKATTSLLVEAGGRVLENEGLYHRAHLVLSLGFAASFGTQAYVEQQRKVLRKDQRRLFPAWRKALELNQTRFEQLGVANKLHEVTELWPSVIESDLARDRFWAYEQACVASLGYGFAVAILEEDAIRYHQAELAYANFVESEIFPAAVKLTLAAADLYTTVEMNPGGWRRSKSLRNGLFFLRLFQKATREAFESARTRSIPTEEKLRAYREGLALAKRVGVSVIKSP